KSFANRLLLPASGNVSLRQPRPPGHERADDCTSCATMLPPSFLEAKPTTKYVVVKSLSYVLRFCRRPAPPAERTSRSAQFSEELLEITCRQSNGMRVAAGVRASGCKVLHSRLLCHRMQTRLKIIKLRADRIIRLGRANDGRRTYTQARSRLPKG